MGGGPKTFLQPLINENVPKNITKGAKRTIEIKIGAIAMKNFFRSLFLSSDNNSYRPNVPTKATQAGVNVLKSRDNKTVVTTQ